MGKGGATGSGFRGEGFRSGIKWDRICTGTWGVSKDPQVNGGLPN